MQPYNAIYSGTTPDAWPEDRARITRECRGIVDELENPPIINDEGDELEGLEWCRERWAAIDSEGNLVEDARLCGGMDYLAYYCLEVIYFFSTDGECRGGEVCRTFGGPNIRINTRWGYVQAAQGGVDVVMPFADNIGLAEAVEEAGSLYTINPR